MAQLIAALVIWRIMNASGNQAAIAGRASCLLFLAVLLTGCAQSLFYIPTQVFYDTPKRVGLRFEEVSFSSYDGTRLTGWFFPASGYSDSRNAKGTVVHFHDNARNISAHWQYVEWLPRRGFNLLVFDYRGFGASEGIPDPQGVFEDSSSALDYVRSRPDVNPDQLVLLGQSIGGANAIAVVGSGNRDGVRAIVIEATFYSYSSIASEKVSWAGALMDDTYSPERYIANLSPIPFLLLHGTADSVIPFPHATKLFGNANEPKRLIAVEGGRHIEAFTPRFGTTYTDIVSEFLGEACQDRPR